MSPMKTQKDLPLTAWKVYRVDLYDIQDTNLPLKGGDLSVKENKDKNSWS